MKTISIIRDRGQLTIPDSIRQVVNWVTPLSAVSISVIKADEIVIRPHQVKLNKNEIWKKIKNARSLHGKLSISTSEFLIKDRQR